MLPIGPGARRFSPSSNVYLKHIPKNDFRARSVIYITDSTFRQAHNPNTGLPSAASVSRDTNFFERKIPCHAAPRRGVRGRPDRKSDGLEMGRPNTGQKSDDRQSREPRCCNCPCQDSDRSSDQGEAPSKIKIVALVASFETPCSKVHRLPTPWRLIVPMSPGIL